MEFFSNPLHLALLIVVIVLVFGASKLGDVGGALGKSIREFKKEAGAGDPPKPAPPAMSGYEPPAPQVYSEAAPVAPPAAPVNGYAPVAPQAPTGGYIPATPAAVPPTPAPPQGFVPGDYRPAGQAAAAAPPPPARPAAPPEYTGR